MEQVISPAQAEKSDSEDKYSSPGYRAYALALLTAVYMFNYIDRKILVILQEPIKIEFGLSDTQLGLLSGFAFVLFYVVLGIPIARWADRGVRRNIIALAIGVWSLMTAVCGFTQNYTQLLLARMGVGIGEAGGSPPAHSMISDIFPPHQRGTAMSIYSIGVYIGILVGFIAGGWIGQHFGWRMAFVVVGIPGILVAILVRLTLQEPRRGGAEKLKVVEPAPPTREVFRLLWSKKSFRYIALASGMSAFFANSLIGWMPSFLMRSHGLSIGEVGTWLALILGTVGGIGTFFGGYLSDRFGKIDKRWYPMVPAIAIALALPFTLATFLLPNYHFALATYCIPVLISGMYIGPVLAITHSLVNVRSRAMASAIFFLIQNMIGSGLGPFVVGMVSDFWLPTYGEHSLRYALVATSIFATVFAVIFYSLSAISLRNDLQQSEQSKN